MSEPPPLCASCGHHHEQGVRCPQCGHVGKSQLFSKMKGKAAEKRAIRTEVYSAAIVAQCGPMEQLISMLLPSLDHSPPSIEARRLLLFKGDLALGAAAFDVLPVVSAGPASVMLCVHAMQVFPEYQRQGYSWWMLHAMLEHVAQSQRQIHTVTLLVPSGSWAECKLRGLGFLTAASLAPLSHISTRSDVWLEYILSCVEQTQKLADFVLEQRTRSAQMLE